VDRLLANPHYGERLALDWLDAARFADTHGFHIDSGRDMTRWRKGHQRVQHESAVRPIHRRPVPESLPNATLRQRLATGFNRNHMINSRAARFRRSITTPTSRSRDTTGTVWLGLTVACVQCHDTSTTRSTKGILPAIRLFYNVRRMTGRRQRQRRALLRVPSGNSRDATTN